MRTSSPPADLAINNPAYDRSHTGTACVTRPATTTAEATGRSRPESGKEGVRATSALFLISLIRPRRYPSTRPRRDLLAVLGIASVALAHCVALAMTEGAGMEPRRKLER